MIFIIVTAPLYIKYLPAYYPKKAQNPATLLLHNQFLPHLAYMLYGYVLTIAAIFLPAILLFGHRYL